MSRGLDIADALLGSALFGILLLHSIEHWDFLHPPEHAPAWLARLAGPLRWVWRAATLRLPQVP